MHIDSNWFSASKIHASGQCFRWKKRDDGSFLIPAFERELVLCQESENRIYLDCTEEEFELFWKDYFDLSFDYAEHSEKSVSAIGSDYLDYACRCSRGIRILRQELWETVISFIISANNNIPRIRKILSSLCESFGRFPSPLELYDLGEEKIRMCGAGYRDKYLVNTAKYFLEHDINGELMGLSYPEAKKYLMKLSGVGPKVADCICLFSLGYKDAFPRDVWIKRIEKEHFGGRFPEEKSFGGAGILQQYLFYYERSLSEALEG
ncbi:MAG: DNA glycosylase [Oscillospiraceae bacterium]|nr:DNA glycosylase [Oscillospiraceae bacterium]